MTKNYLIPNGLIAGLVASIVSSIYLLIIASLPLSLNDFNIITIQGSLLGLVDNIIGAWILYFAIGIFIWGILYALIEPQIKGDALSKGLVFGIFIFLVVMMIIMPLGNAGFFATKYGFIAVVVTLILDLIFGVTLALTYRKLNANNI